MIASAVNDFVTDATPKTVSGVTGASVPISRYPNPSA